DPRRHRSPALLRYRVRRVHLGSRGRRRFAQGGGRMRVGSIARGGTTPRTPRSGPAGLRRRLIGTAAAAGMILSWAAAAGGGDDGDSAAEGGGELKGTTIEVAAKWTGPEEENFRKVLDAFQKKTGATVTYASTGETTDAFLGPRI